MNETMCCAFFRGYVEEGSTRAALDSSMPVLKPHCNQCCALAVSKGPWRRHEIAQSSRFIPHTKKFLHLFMPGEHEPFGGSLSQLRHAAAASYSLCCHSCYRCTSRLQEATAFSQCVKIIDCLLVLVYLSKNAFAAEPQFFIAHNVI